MEEDKSGPVPWTSRGYRKGDEFIVNAVGPTVPVVEPDGGVPSDVDVPRPPVAPLADTTADSRPDRWGLPEKAMAGTVFGLALVAGGMAVLSWMNSVRPNGDLVQSPGTSEVPAVVTPVSVEATIAPVTSGDAKPPGSALDSVPPTTPTTLATPETSATQTSGSKPTRSPDSAPPPPKPSGKTASTAKPTTTANPPSPPPRPPETPPTSKDAGIDPL